MPGPADPLSRSVVQRTLELQRRRLWDEVRSDSPFLIACPGEPHPLGAVMLGESESEPGLMLLRGPMAFPCLVRLNTLADKDHFLAHADLLSATLARLADQPPAFRELLAHAGHQARRDALVPSVAVRRPGAPWRPPRRAELRLLDGALGAVLAAHESGQLTPAPCAPLDRRALLLEASGGARAPAVTARLVPWPAGTDTPEVIEALLRGSRGSTPQDRPLEPLEVIDAVFAETVATVASGLASPPSTPPPDADEESVRLAAWKTAERDLIGFLLLDLGPRAVTSSRALKRYFVAPELAALVLLKLGHWSPMQTYLDWLLCDHRPTHRSATRIEKLLRRKSIPSMQRALLEAHRDGELSFYRVESVRHGATIEVQNLLSGRRHTLHDRQISEAVQPGLVLPLRLLRVESFTLPHVAGPPLMPLQVDHALRWLEDLGADLASPDTLRQRADLLGHLWLDALARRDVVPELQNTDGEPLRRHTASFVVDDPAGLQRSLAARDDVVWDAERLEGLWLRPGPPAPGFGDTTILANLELLGDRLVAEVNSAERLERARAWIEELPGVRFEHVTERDARADDRPLDDRLPAAAPREDPAFDGALLAEVERMYRQACLATLDQPVPALGGLTPRAACATDDGRRRVVRWIRSMPPSRGPGGAFEPPRDDLFRELGLPGD